MAVKGNPVDTKQNWRDDPRYQDRVTSLGFEIMPLYYRHIPDHDPATPAGKEWYRLERSGTIDLNWDSEYEIDFSASSGGLIYPHFDVRRDCLLYPVKPEKHWEFAIAIDPGVQVTAAIIACLSDTGIAYLLAEYYDGSAAGSKIAKSAPEHAEAMIRMLQRIVDDIWGVNADNGRSYMEWSKVFRTQLLDPSSWRREGSNEDLGSVAQRYIDAGFDELEKGTKDLKGGIDRVLEWELRSVKNQHPSRGWQEWVDPPIGCPKKFVNPGLKNYIAEKQKYHRDPQSDEPADKQADHLMDCERTVLVHFRENPSIPREALPKPTKDQLALERAMQHPSQRGRYYGLPNY